MKQIQPFQKHWLRITSIVVCRLNTLETKQNGSHFANDIFKRISFCVLCYVVGSINNKTALVQITPYRRLAIVWIHDGL